MKHWLWKSCCVGKSWWWFGSCYFQEHPNHALVVYKHQQSHLQPLIQVENSKAKGSLLISSRWETELRWTGFLSRSLNIMNRLWEKKKVCKFVVHILLNRLKWCLAHLCLVWKLKLGLCIRKSTKNMGEFINSFFIWQMLEITCMY